MPATHLELRMTTSSDPLLTADGEIHSTANPTGPALVSDVTTNLGGSSFFVLDSGTFFYLFALTTGQGACTIEVRRVESAVVVASDSASTTYGRFGKTLKFTV